MRILNASFILLLSALRARKATPRVASKKPNRETPDWGASVVKTTKWKGGAMADFFSQRFGAKTFGSLAMPDKACSTEELMTQRLSR